MATTPGARLPPLIFGGGFTAVAVLVTIFSASVLAGSLSAGLLMQLAFGGEMPATALVAALLLFVGAGFIGLGLLFLFGYLS